MDKKRKPQGRDGTSARLGGNGGPAAGGDAMFNDWLETKLRSAYNSVLDEPIPDDLIDLINEKLKD